jgi:hypothetical protein
MVIYKAPLSGTDSFADIRCKGTETSLCSYSLPRKHDYRAVTQQWTSAQAPPFRLSAAMSQYVRSSKTPKVLTRITELFDGDNVRETEVQYQNIP